MGGDGSFLLRYCVFKVLVLVVKKMTEEQIFELASKHLRYFDDGWRGTEYSGEPQDILKFAQEIYNKGYEDGVNMMRNVEDYD